MVAAKERVTLDIEVSAELRERLDAVAASKGVAPRVYCAAAVEEALDRDARVGAAGGGRPISREAVERMRALKREIFKGGKLPGNSADIIREEREKRAERIDQTRPARESGNPGGAQRRSIPPQRPVIPAKAGTYWT